MRTTNSCCNVDLETLIDSCFDSDLKKPTFVIVKSANHFKDLIKRLLQLRNLIET